MPMPSLSPVAERLYEALAPHAYADADNDYSLAHFCAAIARMFDQVASYVDSHESGPDGWAAMMSPDTAPVEALGWLGQFVGVSLPTGLSDEVELRSRVRTAAGLKRGTLASMRSAIQDTLIGGKTVTIIERAGGDAYRIEVITHTADTPDPAKTEAALLSQKPAGIMYTYSSVASEAWDEAVSTWDTAPAVSWDESTSGI